MDINSKLIVTKIVGFASSPTRKEGAVTTNLESMASVELSRNYQLDASMAMPMFVTVDKQKNQGQGMTLTTNRRQNERVDSSLCKF